LRDQIRDTAAQLLSDEKRNLPMVKPHLPLIEALQAEGWWTDVTPAMEEEVRRHLRQLVPFVDRDQQQPVYTDFADEMHLLQEADVPTYSTGFSRYQYEKQVKAFILSQESHVAIAKLRRNLPPHRYRPHRPRGHAVPGGGGRKPRSLRGSLWH
jgi:type I restriction enzyme R subunit